MEPSSCVRGYVCADVGLRPHVGGWYCSAATSAVVHDREAVAGVAVDDVLGGLARPRRHLSCHRDDTVVDRDGQAAHAVHRAQLLLDTGGDVMDRRCRLHNATPS